MGASTEARVDGMAVVVGAIRLASGVSFLVAPEAANRLWGDDAEPDTTTSLLLRSMGYRDALIGGLLLTSALRRGPATAGMVPGLGRCRRRRPARRSGQPPADEPRPAAAGTRGRRGRHHRRRARRGPVAPALTASAVDRGRRTSGDGERRRQHRVRLGRCSIWGIACSTGADPVGAPPGPGADPSVRVDRRARRRRHRPDARRAGGAGRRERRRQVDAHRLPGAGAQPRRRRGHARRPAARRHRRPACRPTASSVVWQDLALCDNLDAVANLFLGPGAAVACCSPRATCTPRRTGCSTGLGIDIPDLYRPVSLLSGGQRQLVAIARAVLGPARGSCCSTSRPRRSG